MSENADVVRTMIELFNRRDLGSLAELRSYLDPAEALETVGLSE
jgi:hypothetical protein